MGLFDQFLNATETITVNSKDLTIVNASNPLNWGQLGTAIIATLIGAVAIGLQRVIDGLLSMPVKLLSGVTNWLGGAGALITGDTVESITVMRAWGLIGTVQTGLVDIIVAAWSGLQTFGWLAFPFAVGGIVASFWVIAEAIAYVREEVI